MFPSQHRLQSFHNSYHLPQYIAPSSFIPSIPLPFHFNNPLAAFPLTHPSLVNQALPCLPRYFDPAPLQQLSQSLHHQLVNLPLPNNMNINFGPKISSPLSLSSKSRLASPDKESMPLTKTEPSLVSNLPDDPEIRLEAQIKYLIQFFISNLGIVSNKEIQQAKKRYENDPQLLAVFCALQSKYSTIVKTREEMIKWIVRRSIKTTKKSLKEKKTANKKNLLNEICKKYFNDTSDHDSGDDIVDSVLPFRKNSKNKTMNTNFITEIFQSEGFKQDYKEFLKRFDQISEAENSEKIRRFTQVILECTKKNKYDVIVKYKRVPWLKLWIQHTKIVAVELDEGDFVGKTSKKFRTCP